TTVRRLHELVQSTGQAWKPDRKGSNTLEIFGNYGVANKNAEWPTPVSKIFETSFEPFKWPQPLLKLIDRVQIRREIGSRNELVVVLGVKIIRKQRLTNALTQSPHPKPGYGLREIGAPGCGMRQFCRKKAHGSYCACPSVLRLNSASDSA